MKQLIFIILCFFVLTGCKHIDSMQPTPPPQPKPITDTIRVSASKRIEQYRPQIHYTVLRNWMNDACGMFWKDGRWHLGYQYNPYGIGCDFAHLGWGHASSTDLFHWTEHSPTLYYDRQGPIFSGCAIVDTANVAGFGKDAILAFYTIAGGSQQIGLAVSNNGYTYTKYSGNPVVFSSLPDFRDPKVVWDAQRKRWTMVIARGGAHGIEIWHSNNLLQWNFDGIFSTPIARCNMGQWECPDLIPFGDKWVLLISVNANGPTIGSGVMYFVGNFDGQMFYPDDDDYPLWLDYGPDCYAATTFANAPSERKILMPWLNNWDYAPLVPPTQWKSAFGLPREVSLQQIQGKYRLCGLPVIEIENLADSAWIDVGHGPIRHSYYYQNPDAWQVHITSPITHCDTLVFSNHKEEECRLLLNGPQRQIVLNRGDRCGQHSFSTLYPIPTIVAPVYSDSIDLNIFIDQSSIEIFAQDGSAVISATIYPQSIYTELKTTNNQSNVAVRTLQTVW